MTYVTYANSNCWVKRVIDVTRVLRWGEGKKKNNNNILLSLHRTVTCLPKQSSRITINGNNLKTITSKIVFFFFLTTTIIRGVGVTYRHGVCGRAKRATIVFRPLECERRKIENKRIKKKTERHSSGAHPTAIFCRVFAALHEHVWRRNIKQRVPVDDDQMR